MRLNATSPGPMALFCLVAALSASTACTGSGLGVSFSAPAARTPGHSPDVALSRPPYDQVHVDWKQRVEQPYIYLELLGDTREAGRWIPLLVEHAAKQNAPVSGPPFGLYFDDPARTPVAERRARICLPVAAQLSVASPLGFAVLPAANVAYARVSGAYPDVMHSHAGVFGYMRERGWALDGPVRETYLVNPATVRGHEELITEVQVPWRALF